MITIARHILTLFMLTLISLQASSNVVFTTTPPNPSPTDTPLTFSWIDDCEFITIDYGDGFTDSNPATLPNTIVHAYEIPGTYQVDITGNVCNTVGEQDFITVFITAGGGGGGPAPVPGTPTPTQVSIERLQLHFDNSLPKITVPRNKKDLQAHASIRYSGSGLFQAFWEVDGRIIERIDRHLLDGDILQLSTPDYTPLPAFISGPHRVRLVVTTPAISPARLPQAVYFVSDLDESALKLDLLAPLNNSTASLDQQLEFSWTGIGQTQPYLLEIYQANSSQKVFSAYANQQQYQLKPQLMQNLLKPEQQYDWQVSVLDQNREKLSSTARNSFSVSTKAWVVDQQFILVVEDSMLGNSLSQRLVDQFQLDVIETFPLASLKQMVTVFRTSSNSDQLLNELQQQKGVIVAQPDYIYRTTASHAAAPKPGISMEPLQDLQILSSLLDIDRIHQQLTGKGTRMAVIDSGVDINHPDFFDAQISTENLIKDEAYSAEIHGTAVTGIIAAQKNALGIIGLAPHTQILALRACRQLQPGIADAECYSSSLARAMDRANIEQVQMANFSFGTPVMDPLLGHLLDQGHQQGMLLIASAGNDRDQQELSFPSSHPRVVSVAGKDGSQLFPSKTVADRADLVAPAQQVFSTITGDRHNFFNGTSMSSAIVSAIVSLGLQNPANRPLPLKQQGRDFCAWVNSALGQSVCKDSP